MYIFVYKLKKLIEIFILAIKKKQSILLKDKLIFILYY